MWRRLRKAGRIAAWVILSSLLLAAAAAIGVILWARSDAGRRRVLAAMERAGQESLHGRLSIGRLEGDLTRELVLRDVTVLDTEGEVAVHVDKLNARYDLLGLVRRRLRVSDVKAEGAYVHAR